ncbi:MAG: lysophospholipase [Spirochaetales bacterium]|nr:lysophospholipase [Spirochaetales bacterium]
MMKEHSFTFSSRDGLELHALRWVPSGLLRTRGVVQLVHGMAEHKERYKGFAEFLTGEGFAVYIHDVRGHGMSAGGVENQGFFAEKDGWIEAVEDLRILGALIREEQKDIPFFLFGHSMGSLMARTFAMKYKDDLAGLILSGTSAGKGALEDVGLLIAALQTAFKGPKHPSKLHHNLTFGAFNKPFEPGRTAFDWLTRDEKTVDAYIADPYCGAVFTCSFYRDLITGVKFIAKPEHIEEIRKDLPILLVSGEQDPVGDNTEGVKKVAQGFKAAGIGDVTMKFYHGARHEILNETNRDEVYRDIAEWMKGRL